MSTEPVVDVAPDPTGQDTPAILLVDLSSIAHPIWHTSTSEPDPNAASTRIVARVRSLATAHPQTAICVDSGKSFRKDIDPTYKANRPESDAVLHHQIALAVETLRGDGFPIWGARGYEADDVIATACAKAMERHGRDVVIASADKDLLQLVSPRVRAKTPLQDGALTDEDGVMLKLGVLPFQVRDYLSLVGDTSDNIKGANRIGPKIAAKLLAKHGSLDTLYKAIDEGVAGEIPDGVLASLAEFRNRLPTVRALVTMRTDAPINFDEVLAQRVAVGQDTFSFADEEEHMEETATTDAQTTAPTTDGVEPPTNGNGNVPGSVVVMRQGEIVAAPPAEWERQLDPRSPKEARALAHDLHNSRMFSAYGSPHAVLSTIMVGRELGLPAMAALRSIHNVEGRHTLGASLMVALVLKSGFAEYFDPVEFDDGHAIFETMRKGARKPIQLTHTIAMARTAGLVKPKSNWETVPTDMLVARAQSRLARLVYPDLLAGLYTPDELEEARAGREARGNPAVA